MHLTLTSSIDQPPMADYNRSPSPTKRPSEVDANTAVKRPRNSHPPSLGSPISNRSAKSYLTATFSDKIKRHVKSIYGDRCWVCKAFPAEAAHIITKTDDQFQHLRDLGIVHFSALGDESNAILLCPLCHAQFNRPNPGLVIVPSDLKWFVQWELKDRQRRVAEFRITRIMPQRISPTAEEYERHTCDGTVAAYTQYIRVDYFPVVGNRQPLSPGALGIAKWHGSPTAMIRKALNATAMPTGLPRQLVKDLDQLKILWFVDDPAFDSGTDNEDDDPTDHPPPGTGKSADTDHRSGESASRNAPGPGNDRIPPGNTTVIDAPRPFHSLPLSGAYTSVSKPIQAIPRRQPPTRSSTSLDSASDHVRQPRLVGNPERWMWGPMASAQKVMDYYTLQLGTESG